MHINAKRVIENRIAESMEFNKYKQIMERVRNTDVSSDKDFQRTFNSYYRIRRNEEWQAIYYDLFEAIKDSQPSFEQIIRTLYKNTGNIKASVYILSEMYQLRRKCDDKLFVAFPSCSM